MLWPYFWQIEQLLRCNHHSHPTSLDTRSDGHITAAPRLTGEMSQRKALFSGEDEYLRGGIDCYNLSSVCATENSVPNVAISIISLRQY